MRAGIISGSMFLVAGVTLAAATAIPASIPGTAENGSGPEPVVELFESVCSGCHSPDVVMDRRLDRAGWEVVVRTMIGRGAMASESEVTAIIDYLATTYPAQGSSSGTQGGKSELGEAHP